MDAKITNVAMILYCPCVSPILLILNLKIAQRSTFFSRLEFSEKIVCAEIRLKIRIYGANFQNKKSGCKA
jgi:hypothetical protein